MTKEEFLITFFDALNEKINYFVFGSYKSLPHDTGSSDIDIVIAPEQEGDFLSVFKSVMVGSTAFVASHFGNHMFRILNGDPQQPWGVQIDIFCNAFCHHGVVYFPVSLVKNSVIDYNGIKVLDENRGYYVDFLKEVIHGVEVKQKYIDAFANLIESDRAKYLSELESLYGLSFKNMVETGLDRRKFQVKAMREEMIKSIHKGAFFKDIKSIIQRLSRFFKPKPGYVVAILGTDGSGKSTIINAVEPWLNEGFHNGVVYRHLRPKLLKDLGVISNKRSDNKEGEVVSNPHNGKTSGLLVSLVKWFYYLTDYTIGYLVKVWIKISVKSEVFLFDRYYYDYYIDQKRFGISLPMWLIRIGDFFVPNPDLIICLGGDAEKIYNRKPETSIEEVKRQTEAIINLANRNKAAVYIDTTVPLDNTLTEVRASLIKMLQIRFSIDK